jgi:hypothetical protein
VAWCGGSFSNVWGAFGQQVMRSSAQQCSVEASIASPSRKQRLNFMIFFFA